MKLKDIKGQRFGKLSVIEYAGKNRTSAQWLCECDCGNICIVVGNKLRSGHTKSCSCGQKEAASIGNFIHGMKDTSEYGSWQAMKERCYNPNSASYQYYGGKGIIVCPEWKDDFLAFFADMGLKPDPSYTIERTYNSLNYGPENCYWASKMAQGANTSRNRRISFNGEVKILAEWMRYFQVSPQYFYILERKNGVEGAFSILYAKSNRRISTAI
jgi:hypothetical protein